MTTIMEQQMIIMIQNANLLDILHQFFRERTLLYYIYCICRYKYDKLGLHRLGLYFLVGEMLHVRNSIGPVLRM